MRIILLSTFLLAPIPSHSEGFLEEAGLATATVVDAIPGLSFLTEAVVCPGDNEVQCTQVHPGYFIASNLLGGIPALLTMGGLAADSASSSAFSEAYPAFVASDTLRLRKLKNKWAKPREKTRNKTRAGS